jgi:hypothetical protein
VWSVGYNRQLNYDPVVRGCSWFWFNIPFCYVEYCSLLYAWIVCVSLLYVIDTGSTGSRGNPVTWGLCDRRPSECVSFVCFCRWNLTLRMVSLLDTLTYIDATLPTAAVFALHPMQGMHVESFFHLHAHSLSERERERERESSWPASTD